MIRLLLDVHISPRVAAALATRGYDVITADEAKVAYKVDDPQVWESAIGLGRAVVTYNVCDFVPLCLASLEAATPHFGLICIHRNAIPASDVGGLVRALAHLIDIDLTLADQAPHWLRRI